MKRFLGLLKERGGVAASETREPWSPAGEGPAAPAPAAPAASESEAVLPLEGHPLEEKILTALKGVYDPEIPVNIYELGLIYEVKLTAANDLFVKMTLTAPGCPVAGQMPGMVQASIEEHVPEARAIDVELVWDPPWTKDRMSEAARLETGMF